MVLDVVNVEVLVVKYICRKCIYLCTTTTTTTYFLYIIQEKSIF